jgi:hypothetical protein
MAGRAPDGQPANARISAHPVYTRCSPMTEPGSQDRLDSWKAIADYLGRDVATVRRWEKSLGLPVRRVAGGPGRSVFAYRHEIEAWLKASQAADAPAITEPPPPVQSPWPRRVAIVGLVMAVVMGISYAWRLKVGGQPLHLELSADRIVARDAAGLERWRYDFAPARAAVFYQPQAVKALANNRGFLVAAASTTNTGNGAIGNGELLWLSADGEQLRRTAFTERLAYGPRSYGGPWVIADYSLGPDFTPDHIAVAVRHYQWWPGVVALLGPDWQPTQKFVNAGWVEHVVWMQPDRVVISGFYNPLDGGMVALLNPAAMNGASPQHTSDPTFTCTSCGPDTALRYVVMPRSEINRALTAPFNRAQVQVTADRLVVRTVEEPNDNGYAAEALYEFTTDLELISASYGDRYWDRHRALEASGRLDHPRERCPERRGPPSIRMWVPGAGWSTVVPHHD